jgi:hypothetical protein
VVPIIVKVILLVWVSTLHDILTLPLEEVKELPVRLPRKRRFDGILEHGPRWIVPEERSIIRAGGTAFPSFDN